MNFSFTAGTLRVSAKAQETGTSNIEMPIAYGGEPAMVRLDYRYLGDFLKALDADAVCRVRLVDSKQPALFSAEGYEYVSMPMALEQ